MLLGGATVSAGQVDQKISRPGEYSGYSERIYDGYERKSQYVAVRDGTRLAVDVYIPTRNGVRAKKKLPALYYSTHYVRAKTQKDGSLTSIFKIEDKDSTARFLLEHGYVIVIADVRGSGASFGKRSGYDKFYETTGQDSYDLIEWMARQPWCAGNVGMFGGSFMGHQQIAAAGANPPSLKAIIPHGNMFWGINIPSGSPIRSGMEYQSAVSRLDGREDGELSQRSRKWLQNSLVAGETAPVDGREGTAQLEQAIKERTAEKVSDYYIQLEQLLDMFSTSAFNSALYSVSERAIQSKIPHYAFNGLYDLPSTPLLFHANAKGPSKALVGPWTHGASVESDGQGATHLEYPEAHSRYLKVEALRWHDYWLKGIENGIMDEPALHYAVIGADPQQWAWIAAENWPAPQVKRRDFHFAASSDKGKGALRDSPNKRDASLKFTVDYTAGTGRQTRYWDFNGYGPISYPEMSEVNKKGLTFTSDPLPKDMAIAGAPIVELLARSTNANPQIHAFLEKVTADGRSIFVTDGAMLASWRQLTAPPFNYLGWPFSDGSRAAQDATPPLSAGADVLRFKLVPAGMVFEKGSRIRVLITGADADNWYQEEISPAPQITIFTGKTKGSKISLPLVEDIDALSVKK